MLRVCCGSALAISLTLVGSAADWPQWRGPDRTGISRETGLLKEWPSAGPPLRWKAEGIGTGYSTPAVAGGKVYLQTTKGNEEFALVLDEKTGKEIWKTKIGGVGPNKGPQYPGTRATPTVDADRVYCLASDGELTCLDSTGKAMWHKNFAKDFAGQVGAWAYSESVLVDGDAVICTPGGKTATLVALNKMTGETIWSCAVPGGDIADYASIMTVETGGRKQYVQFLRKGVVGVDAKTGQFLWQYTKTADFGANMLTPIINQGKVFTSARPGGALLELTSEGEGVKATEVYFQKAITSGIGGAVLVDGYIYGTANNDLVCIEFATGKVMWSEPTKARAAALCYADGMIYLRGQGGNKGAEAMVLLVEPSPKGYVEKGKFAQPTGGFGRPGRTPSYRTGAFTSATRKFCSATMSAKGRRCAGWRSITGGGTFR